MALRGPESQLSQDLLRQLLERTAQQGGRKNSVLSPLATLAQQPLSMTKTGLQQQLLSPLFVKSVNVKMTKLLREGRPDREKALRAAPEELFRDMLNSGSPRGLKLFKTVSEFEEAAPQSGVKWQDAYRAWLDQEGDSVMEGGNKWFYRKQLDPDRDYIADAFAQAGVTPKPTDYAFADFQRLTIPGGGPKEKYSEHAVFAPTDIGLTLKMRSSKYGGPTKVLEGADRSIYTDNTGHFPLFTPLSERSNMAGHFRASQTPEGYFVQEVQPDILQIASKKKMDLSPALQETPLNIGQAAIGEALRSKAGSVWFPTNANIQSVRSDNEYSKLYDSRLVNELLNPLASRSGQSVVEQDGWRGLNLSDELKREWLNKGIPYAKGGTVQDPDQMTHKPQPKTANPLAAVFRGWAAGTGGLGRDAEDLTRLVAKYFSAPGSIAERYGQGEAVLPSTEFYKDWLPGKSLTEGIGGQELESLGSLTGGMGSTTGVRAVGSMGKWAASGTKARQLAEGLGDMGRSYVIRNTGDNNFLKGSVENALKGLKRGNPEAMRDELAVLRGMNGELPRYAKADQDILKTESINKFVEGPLTRYVKQQMATPDDPVRALAEQGVFHLQLPEEHLTGDWVPEAIAAARKRAGFPETAVATTPRGMEWEMRADQAIDPHTAGDLLGVYKGSGAYGEDMLQNNPWLATKPPETKVFNIDDGRNKMLDLGFGHLTDELRNALNPESGLPRNLLLTPEKLQNMGMERAVRHVAAINDWRERAALTARKAAAEGIPVRKEYPDLSAASTLYHPNVNLPITGSHAKLLSSYLENSLPLNYALQEGKLTPALTKQAEMLDQLIATHGIEAPQPTLFYRGVNSPDKGKSFLSVTPHKDIAARFGKVEEVRVPKGTKMLPVSGEFTHPSLIGKLSPEGEEAVGEYLLPRGTSHGNTLPNPQGLRWLSVPDTAKDEKALKFACDIGKQGGWCTQGADAAKRHGSEGNQLHVLVDAKGDPHVQINTGPPNEYASRYKPFDQLNDTEKTVFSRELGHNFDSMSANPDWLFNPTDQTVARASTLGPSIIQIKRKANLVNSDPYEYRPFVQDFVKSGKWSDVGDMANTGLVKIKGGSTNIYDGPNKYKGLTMPDTGYYTPRELADHFETQGVPRLAARQHAGDIDGLTEALTPPEGYATGGRVSMIHPAAAIQPLVRVPGFAQGGSVYNPARVDEIIAQHRNSEYDPARVDALVAQLKEELYA